MPEKVFYHSIVWAVSFGTHALLNVFSYVCWMAGNVAQVLLSLIAEDRPARGNVLKKQRKEGIKMDEKILDYMTKTEYASEHAGVVKNAEHADSATGSQFAENAVKLGGNGSTYYASAASVTTLGATVNGVLVTANNAQATASEAKTDAATADAKAVAAQAAAAAAKDIAEAAQEPAGCMKFFAGGILPAGYLWCDGTSYPANGNYAKLYETIGTKYNETNDEAGTFRVPDMRGRVGIGKDAGTFDILGKTGGEEKHTLTIAEIPSHSHTFLTNYIGAAATVFPYQTGKTSGPQSTSYTGGGQTHNNLQPYLVCNYIIKY